MNRLRLGILVAALGVAAVSCGGSTDSPIDASEITVYSGRSEELVGPVFERFTSATGIRVNVRYGETAELAAAILEAPAAARPDVFFAQDAGALGALAREGLFGTLGPRLINRVPERFHSAERLWVGVTGRARTVVYNTRALKPDDLPDSILDFTKPEWKGKIGWAPTNGSFQSFVTALRAVRGDDAARTWLRGIIANRPISYPKNTAIVQAVGAGEIEVGFVNHYYVLKLLAEDPSLEAANRFSTGGDADALVNVAGVGILESSSAKSSAGRLVDFLLSRTTQEYFATETFEYPLIEGIAADPRLPALEDLNPPNVDLSDLYDLRGTLDMLEEVGAL